MQRICPIDFQSITLTTRPNFKKEEGDDVRT